MVSIVIPTFNEKMNVIKIADRIKTAISNIYDYEIIFVDDSSDNTPEYLENLKYMYKNIKYLHRTGKGGLATAVVCGIDMSKGDIIVVMDGDLQHPPELLPEMIKNIEEGWEIIIPSRHLIGGDEGGLNIFRKIVSHTASAIGKIFLKKLRNISDPTGGFLAFKRKILDGVVLNPVGWKILIEILVRGKYTKVKEIPYKFEKRDYGNSKMSFVEQVNYLKHIFRLVRDSIEDRRIFIFAIVGSLGVIINMIFYNIFVFCGLGIGISGTFSALIAMIGNFILNRNITWKDKKTENFFVEALKFLAISSFGIIINIIVLSSLHYKIKVNYNIANLIGICGAILWNYNLNRLWTWKNNLRSH
jgi:dolichol-phosphate mannosyltransferase